MRKVDNSALVKAEVMELSGVGVAVASESRRVVCAVLLALPRDEERVVVNMSLTIVVDTVNWVTAHEPITVYNCRKLIR